MKCEQIQPNLLDYATGRLTGLEVEAIKTHLAECAECAALMEEEVAFSKCLSALPDAQSVKDVWPVIMEQTAPRRVRPLAWLNGVFATNLRRTAVAAAAVTVLFVSVYGLKPDQPAPSQDHRQAKVVTVNWSDDPLGKHTDAMLDYIDNM